jgi:branched-chain amino acid transport system permease protein
VFYREAGQYKTTYAADMAIFPIRQDRYGMALILFIAFVLIPAFGNPFLINTMMIPFLIFSLSAIGLNLLTGYTGLLSLGTGAFMGVGAYACYKLETIFPQVNILVWIIMSGLVSALVGVVFGLPSLRIKGFYLAVATLAAQFFLEWCFARVPWLVNYNNSGAIEVPTETLFGLPVTGPTATGRLDHRRSDGLDRFQHRARADRAHVDGGARHGHRRGAYRHPVVARETPRFRRVVVHHRRRGRLDGVPVVRRSGG